MKYIKNCAENGKFFREIKYIYFLIFAKSENIYIIIHQKKNS